jgi:hypothetical protein
VDAPPVVGRGLVELVTGHATRPTLTEQAAYWRSLYVGAQASLDATYRAYCRRYGDHHGSAAGLLEALRAQVACYGARVRRVALTPNGHAAVNKSFDAARERLTSMDTAADGGITRNRRLRAAKPSTPPFSND